MKTLKEEDVQRQVIDLFTALGFQVWTLARRGIKTPTGTVYGDDGCSKGLSDLFVRWPDWPQGMHLAIEVKRPKNWSWREGQKEGWISGATAKVHSSDQALVTVFFFWIDSGLPDFPDRFLRMRNELVPTPHGFYDG